MKGIIFTEFTELVEEQFGILVLDQIIESNNLPSKGVYTSVGTYDHQEIVLMLISLSKITSIHIDELLRKFGHHLLRRFVKNYPHFFESQPTPFDFLSSVESHIHVEVKRLYPDAQLPRFKCSHISEDKMMMHYYSEKHLQWLAVGLIEGVLRHYDVKGDVQLLPSEGINFSHTDILIQLNDGRI